jgi:hypothetical protein
VQLNSHGSLSPCVWKFSAPESPTESPINWRTGSSPIREPVRVAVTGADVQKR